MPTIKNQKSKIKNTNGFTTIELVMVIVVLGILSAVVAIKWPTGMKNEAAVLEFQHAVRYAQHMAMTRQYITGTPWGIRIATCPDAACPNPPTCTANIDIYTVQRGGGSAETAEPEFRCQNLPGNATISHNSVWFNGLGEPIQTDGTALGDTTFTITDGGDAAQVTVFSQTGYVQ